jgi:hypothetical protein
VIKIIIYCIGVYTMPRTVIVCPHCGTPMKSAYAHRGHAGERWDKVGTVCINCGYFLFGYKAK